MFCWPNADIYLITYIELYTDESPGLKVDPVVVLVLSLVFIFSVVALHSELSLCSVAVASGSLCKSQTARH